VPTSRRTRSAGLAAAVAVALVVSLAVVLTLRHVAPTLLTGSGCTVDGNGQAIPLDPGQAGIASTIAGVARHDAMPARAVTVAYAAALQESKLTNLHYGDRDSVGVFQQRPSEGWGPARRLEDPVYATTKFFAALATVPGYRRIPVYRAAQAVQHSADGHAYGQYQQTAVDLSRAFTGRSPHAVWCWYDGGTGRLARLTAAARELTKTFGPLAEHRVGDPVLHVHVTSANDGWAMAAWLVSHASGYGIREVRYLGYQWTTAQGDKGWARERARGKHPAPPGSVVLG
jgi:hypothetical protein